MRHRLLPVIVAAIAAPLMLAAQSVPPAVDPEMRFEVVSIKSSDPSVAPRMSRSPGRYEVAGVRLLGIVGDAFRVAPNRIFGLPDWSVNERYAIAAKVPEGLPSTDGRAMAVMLKNLLKDRFKIATHTETREMPVFNLVLARNDKRFGPAFKESSAKESVRINPGGTASLSGVRTDMIAQVLTPYVGRTVIDKTGLTSYYNVTLKWTPDVGRTGVAPPALPPGTLPLDPDAPNLFTAVQEQLGLKLENARAPLDVVVIDRVEKPTLD